MTVVKRPAYITRSCPSPDSGFWDDFNPSLETRVKSASVKSILEQHFSDLMKETQDYQSRLRTFHQIMHDSDLVSSDKEALYKEFVEQEVQNRRLLRRRMKVSDFQKIRIIGKGGYGLVWLVRDKVTSELYALKVLRKADIISQDQLVNVHTERIILSGGNPWTVNLIFSFQDSEKLYLVLDYMCGGDLMTALIKSNYFSESITRFFCGEIVLALHSLHMMNYLHRDLKPDNILIGQDGHIKLTDFGLSSYSKLGIPETRNLQILDSLQSLLSEYSAGPANNPLPNVIHERSNRGNFVGTCDYTAPEILKGQNPTTASDFWSLGVILYEMLFGHPPFSGHSTNETILKIIHWKRSLNFSHPIQPVSEDAIDLIQHLLCDAEDRYSYEQIISHKFFNSFNFQNYKLNQPPMVPVLKNRLDTCHFDSFDENTEEPLSPKGDIVPGGDLAKIAFWGYTFKKHSANQALLRLGADLF